MGRWFFLLLLIAPACRSKSVEFDTSEVDSDGLETANPDSATDSGEDTAEEVIDEDGDGLDSETDCDDTNPEIGGAQTWYFDHDTDGFGDPLFAVIECEPPAGYVAVGSDCNDLSASAYPGAEEYCDGIDNNCDGAVDEATSLDVSTWYADADTDGTGDPNTTIQSCEQPSGYLDDASDCDDTNAGVHPSATETCDGLDNNCDGTVDEDSAADAATWYADSDADSYGDASSSTTACAQPSGYAGNDTDCDDTSPAVNPGATEVCDGIDNDCDGATDENDAADATLWYLDYDSDGYGEDATATGPSCSAPTPLYVSSGGDCDDTSTDYNPAATEGCDGTDHNCDGQVDNDADGDGYADEACGGDDCSDTDNTIYPDTSGACALGTSCDDILTKGYSTGDGVYSIDPDGYETGDDPEDAYCNMSLSDGGWTLIATNTSGGGLNTTSIVDNTAFGSPDFLSDYKAQAFSNLNFEDILFEDGTLHAVYEGVGSGAETFYGFISGLDSAICGSTTSFKYNMSAGTFTGANLCETTLFFNTIDEDGDYNTTCDPNGTYADNATGPAWSTFNNNGCPHDDASSSAFINPSSVLPWDTAAPLNMYVR
ncbi:MAG: MopE-related protein [Myxococcota bacterium]|nr:MopE-related protein [Myxococcota bacterium]